MSESLALVAPGRPMLEYLPVGLFGSVMGLTGLSVAWRLAYARHGAPEWIALVIAAVAVVVDLTFAEVFARAVFGKANPAPSKASIARFFLFRIKIASMFILLRHRLE